MSPLRGSDSLVGVFAQHAMSDGDAIAVVDGNAAVSYSALSSSAEAIRESLAAAGVGPGSNVGIAMNKSWRLIGVIIGIMASGANYVPLDPSQPQDRLQYICSDCSVATICIDESTLFQWANKSATLVLADGRHAQSGIKYERSAESGYIIYTSGTTGRPKGVRIPQGHVIELFGGADQVFTFGPDDVWTLFHGYGFDFSVWEIWGALLHGGKLILLDEKQIHDPRLLMPALEWHQVSVLSQVPSMFKYLVREYARRPQSLCSLRYIVFGGESLDKPSAGRWLEMRDGHEALANMYGITETTVHVTHAWLQAADLTGSGDSRIGRPLPHLRVVLLSAEGTPVPVGQPGEMFIAGSTLSPGYVGLPEATAERFVTLDLGDGPERYYRSGDLARQDEAGELFYLGRIDCQFNVRGFRIEAGEVESVLRQVPGVADAFVTAITLPVGDDSLAAVIVPVNGLAPPSTGALRHACAARLPAYMIPDRFEMIAAFPTNINGKTDRKALIAFALRSHGSSYHPLPIREI